MAHIVLQCHLDQLLEKQSVFSPGELERAKAGLESREATIYNNWIHAAHGIECLAMESTITAQGAQKRLLQLLRILDQYHDNYRIRIARLLSPIVLTPEKAREYVEARQQARRDNMAQHEISLFWATAYRAWELAVYAYQNAGKWSGPATLVSIWELTSLESACIFAEFPLSDALMLGRNSAPT